MRCRLLTYTPIVPRVNSRVTSNSNGIYWLGLATEQVRLAAITFLTNRSASGFAFEDDLSSGLRSALAALDVWCSDAPPQDCAAPMPRLCPLCGVSHTLPGILCSFDECPRSSGSELRTGRPALRVKNATHPLMQNHRDLCIRLSECFQIPPKAAWNILKALLHFENPKVPPQLVEKCNFPRTGFV